MRGLGYVPVALLREALQNVGRGGPIVNPFSASDTAFLTWNDPAQPPHAWERIRGSSVYGPGATGNYSWMNTAEWGVSPEGTELLNLNRDIIRYARRFEDINWNDPRIRFPESYMPTPAAQPVPELTTTVAPAPATPAPATPPPSAPDFGTPSAPVYSGGGTVQPIYYSSEPLPDASGGGPTPQVKQAGLFGGALSMPMILTAAGAILFFSLARGAGQMSPAPRRRRRR
jgi:hypothetical protein